ncbi:MAG: phosphoribosyltransferase [Planctomycetes bacterium]|nr:phosphoribosyltransferase [Planctomycetota bacterium]
MFTDRHDAGQQLGRLLLHLKEQQPIVLALPRGGVIVGAEVAKMLNAPLDVLVVRKLGAPNHAELAIGAVTNGEHPQRILNKNILSRIRISASYLEDETNRQLLEVKRLQELYRQGRTALAVASRTVIVVDDGIATGATVRAGIKALRQMNVSCIVLGAAVAPQETIKSLSLEVDELVCPLTPTSFTAVGLFYKNFEQTTDAQVIEALKLYSE